MPSGLAHVSAPPQFHSHLVYRRGPPYRPRRLRERRRHPRLLLLHPQPTAQNRSPIQHIVIIMQENRTFDNLFNGYPGADSVQSGMAGSTVVPLVPIDLGDSRDLDHSHTGWVEEWDNGKLDGFAQVAGSLPYSYVPQSQVQPYWDLAQRLYPGRPHVPVQHRPQLPRASIHDRRPVRRRFGKSRRRRLGMRRSIQRSRRSHRPQRHRPPRRLSLLRLRDHGRPPRRQRCHLAVLRPRPHRQLLHHLRLPGRQPHPLRQRLEHQGHLSRDQHPRRHRQRPARPGHLGRPRLQPLRPPRLTRRGPRLGRQPSSTPSAQAPSGTPPPSSSPGTTGAAGTITSRPRRSTAWASASASPSL